MLIREKLRYLCLGGRNYFVNSKQVINFAS